MALVRRWSALGVLVTGLLSFAVVRQATLQTHNVKFLPTLMLLGASVVPVAFVCLVGGLRLRFGIGAPTVALTALVGGLAGTVTAGVLEYDTRRELGSLPTIGIGLIEEAAKLMAPLVAVLVLRTRHPADGLLLGVAAGAGFAALETTGYALTALLESRGDVAVVDDLLAVRGASSPAGHMAWTGLTATALWYAAAHPRRPGAWGLLLATYLAVAAVHALWDSTDSGVARAVLGALALTALLVTTLLLAADLRRHPAAAPPPEPVVVPQR